MKILSKELLENEYISNNKSIKAIAREFETDSNKILYLLQKYKLIGIKQRKKTESDNLFLNKKIGKLTLIKFCDSPPMTTKDKNARYTKCVECKCECGTVIAMNFYRIKYNQIISCGCERHKKGCLSRYYRGYKEISGKFFNRIKRTAAGGTNRRKRICKEFNLTIEFLWNLFIKQERKCAISGLEIKFDSDCKISNGTASLDRIDSSIGYLENNVQWTHKVVNMMKNKLNQDDFIEWCRIISNNNS